MKNSFCLVLILLLTTSLCVPGRCYPTSANIIPTADILELGLLRMEYENDGYPRVGDSSSSTYYFTQFGLTSSIEVGIDRYDASGDTQDSLNVKYLVKPEDDLSPAFAVGVMDVMEGSSPSYYVVSTKSLGRARVHLGYIHADYSRGPMLGADLEVWKGTYLLADWMRGDANYLTFGVYKEFAGRWAATLIYGFPNDTDNEKLTGVNLSYTIPISITGK